MDSCRRFMLGDVNGHIACYTHMTGTRCKTANTHTRDVVALAYCDQVGQWLCVCMCVYVCVSVCLCMSVSVYVSVCLCACL